VALAARPDGSIPLTGKMLNERRWLTADEFAEYFGLCSFLPGPGLINLSVLD
jgi:chromate transporter